MMTELYAFYLWFRFVCDGFYLLLPVLFVKEFSSANSMYANLVQVCTAINREFIFPGAKKKKEWASGIQCLFCYSVLPMA